MNGIKLTVVEEEKDVGITIHKSLKPARHCQRVAATATGVLKQLTRNFHYRDRTVFFEIIYPVRSPSFGICHTGLVPLVSGGHSNTRKGPRKSSRHDIRFKGKNIRREM
jgi:hypothetical protein